MDCYDYWNKEYQIDKKYKLKGFSRGGLRTGFILLPHKIFLDAGVPTPIKPNLILITHGHQDHIDSLYNHFIDNPEKIEVVGNINLLTFLQDYLDSCKSVNAMKKSKFINWIPRPIISTIDVTICNTKYNIKAYNLDHEVETFGYGLEEVRTKLKEEYIGLTQTTLENLKKDNVNIMENKNYPILFFCGDMGYTSLETLPFESYPVFIIECSFLESEHIIEARSKQHLHINDLIPYVEKYPETHFIFIHFSCRYHKNLIKQYQNNFKYLKNLLFWI
jgi:ribonuclease Z